jgi:hypothetical protein
VLEIVPYLAYESLFGQSLTEPELIARVKRLSRDDCLQSIGKLSHVLAAGRADDGVKDDTTRELVRHILSGLPAHAKARFAHALVQRGPSAPILFGKQLMTLARVVLLHAQDRPPDSFVAGKDWGLFVESLFGVLDVYDGSRAEEANVQDGVEAEEFFSSFRLRRVGMPDRHLKHSIVRAYRVFIDLPSRRPELVTTIAPAAAFEERQGVSMERYLAICFAARARFTNWNREPDAWLLGPSYWNETVLTSDEIKNALVTVSATPAELRDTFEREIEAGRDSIDDVRPFIIKPLVEVDEQVYVPIDLETLDEALLGDGLFWRLRPAGNASQKERSDFGETLGHLLEAHCVEVAEACYERTNRQRRALFTEFRSTAAATDTADITITDPAASAFIEIGIDRANLIDTIFAGDLSSFDRDVQSKVLPRAAQLSRKIDDALAGRIDFPGAPRDTLSRIHPVICLWDGFPLGPYLYERILRAVEEAGYLKQPRVAPLQIIAVEEFEMLCGLVTKNWLFTDLLQEHSQGDWAREAMSEFLRARHRKDLAMPPILEDDFKAIGARLPTALFASG